MPLTIEPKVMMLKSSQVPSAGTAQRSVIVTSDGARIAALNTTVARLLCGVRGQGWWRRATQPAQLSAAFCDTVVSTHTAVVHERT